MASVFLRSHIVKLCRNISKRLSNDTQTGKHMEKDLKKLMSMSETMYQSLLDSIPHFGADDEMSPGTLKAQGRSRAGS